MRFVAIHRPAKNGPPSQQQMESMMKFIDEAVKAGVLLATEGFGPSTKIDARVRLSDGRISVTDGPFSEAKEVIGGFALINATDLAEAVAFAERYVELFDIEVEVEVRQVVEFEDLPQG